MPNQVMPTPGAPNPTGNRSGTAGFERLAKALRENLKKRKDQKREREQKKSAAGADGPSVVPKENHITDIEI